MHLAAAILFALNVPFIAQKTNYCGPAALAMLANYYGHAVSQDEIANAIYLPEIRGTLTTELAAYADRFHLWVRQYRGSRADLRQKLAAGVPLIVLGKLGNHDHYFVVLAADDEIVVHSDARPNLHISEDDFVRWWDRADRWTLLVCPPERATWKLSADEHNDLGVFLERKGELAAARGHYREATELRPDNSYFHMNLGNALMKQKLLCEATAAYQRAVKVDPQNADALNNLAHAYLQRGANLDEAAELCQRAVALNPAHRAYYLDTLGDIRLKQKDPHRALDAFVAALAAATDRESSLRDSLQQKIVSVRHFLGEQPLLKK